MTRPKGMTECGGVDSNWNPKETGYWSVKLWNRVPIALPPWYENFSRWLASKHATLIEWVEPTKENE